jgi:arylsulfatase A
MMSCARCNFLATKQDVKDSPNIVFIMADDMGYGDVGCYNPESKIPTPNMDRLAAEGMRFNDAHAPSAVCTPTRYGVLTGRYCWRTRLKEGVGGGYAAPLIEPDRLTIASMLKLRGYSTACIGKWHIGLTFHDKDGNPTESEERVDFSRPVAGGPTELGFDYAYYNAGCGTCAPPYGFIENRRFTDQSFYFFEAGSEGPVGVGKFGRWRGMMGSSWVTKDADPIIADRACSYIEDRAGQEAPFFLYLTPNAPHEPCHEEYVPDFARGKSAAGARGDLVWLFDWVVGRVTETLKKTGQLDNTLLVVTSDNGALPGDFILDQQGARVLSGTGRNEYTYNCYGHKSNGDWRGYKAHIWDGGHRMPFLVRWPEAVAAGTASDELICLTDMVATCAALAGFNLPDNAAEDSCNILPVLLGKGKADRPAREAVIHHSSFGVFSIRQGRWKLIHECLDSGGWPPPRGSKPISGSPGQLYDILADPHEEHNLWEERKDVVARLAVLLNHYRESGRSAPKAVKTPSVCLRPAKDVSGVFQE